MGERGGVVSATRFSLRELSEELSREAYGNPFGDKAPIVRALVKVVLATSRWAATEPESLKYPGMEDQLPLIDMLTALDLFDFSGVKGEPERPDFLAIGAESVIDKDSFTEIA